MIRAALQHSLDKALLACRTATGKTERLQHFLETVPGISNKNVSNIHKEMWEKFVWISSVGALGALTRSTIGVWRKMPESRALFRKVVREALAVARARAVKLSWWDHMRILKSTDTASGDLKTSMQRDIETGTRGLEG